MMTLLHTVFFNTAQLIDLTPLPTSRTGDDAANAWKVGLLFVAGIMASTAVLLVVINGMQYINASGDPQKTAQARQGILYAVIGLIVVLFAATIVSFVLRGIGG